MADTLSKLWDYYKEQQDMAAASGNSGIATENLLFDNYKGSQSGNQFSQASSDVDNPFSDSYNANNPFTKQEQTKDTYSVQEQAKKDNEGRSFLGTAISNLTEKPEVKTIPLRDRLIEEYRNTPVDSNEYAGWATDEMTAAQMPQGNRRQEILDQLRAIDQRLGNGEMDYSSLDRLGSITSGSAKGWAADMMNAAGTAIRGLGESSASANPALLRAQGLNDEQIKAELERASTENKGQRMTDFGTTIQEKSDNLAQSSAEDIERAKAGTSKLAQFGTDFATNAIQMGMDGLASTLTFGTVNPLTSMFIRSTGGGSREARNEDASTAQQLAYGAVRGGIEVATEKMFDGLAHIYGAGFADEAIEKLIGKLGQGNNAVQTGLRALFSGIGEATEEGVSGLTEPLTKIIYQGTQALEQYKDPEYWADNMYSMLVGLAMGIAGGATNIATGENARANAEIKENINQQNEIRNNLVENNGISAADAKRASEILAKIARGETITQRQAAFLNSVQETNGINTTRPDVTTQQADVQQTQAQQQTPQTQPTSTMPEGQPTTAPTVGSTASPTTSQTSVETPSGELNFNPETASTETQAGTQETPFNQPNGNTLSEAEITQRIADLQMALSNETRPEIRSLYESEINRLQETLSAREGRTASDTETNADTRTETESREGRVPPIPPQEPTYQSTSQDYGQLGEQYGTIKQGEKPVRDSQTPKKTAPGAKVTQSVRSIQEAKATAEARLPNIQSAVAQGKFSFVAISNDSRAKAAQAKIESKGWNQALRDWTAAVRAGQANADLVAEGAVLMNNAANNPECTGAEYIDLMLDYATLSHTFGQGLQAERILKTLSPEGRLYAVTKLVQDMNDDLQKSTSNKQKAEQKKTTQERKAKVNKAVKAAKKKAADLVFTFEYADEASQMIANAVRSRARASTKAQSKTLMEELTGTIKRFAFEHMPKQSRNNRTLTATDILAELSGNEAFARAAYEDAQYWARQEAERTEAPSSKYTQEEWQNILEEAASDPTSEAAQIVQQERQVQEYKNNVAAFTESGFDLTNSNIVKRAIAESAVATSENRSTILNQSALGISANEIANSIANDLISKTNASPDIASAIQQASLEYVQEVLNNETAESTEDSETLTNERLDELVRRAMNQIGENFNRLAISDEYTRDAALQAIRDTLTEQYGVNGQSATRIAETIVGNFDTRLNTAIQEELAKRFGPKEESTITERQMPDRLAEAINLGAFTSEYAEQAINDVFGVQGQYVLDPALVEEYRQQTTDEGRDEVLERMQKAIAEQVQSTSLDIFTAVRYLNMLGNFKTQARNIAGNIGMAAVQKMKNIVRSTSESIWQAATNGEYQRQYSAFYPAELLRVGIKDITQNKAVQREGMGDQKFTSVASQYAKGIRENIDPFKIPENKLTKAFNIDGKKGPVGTILTKYNQATKWAMEMGDQLFVTASYADGLAGYLQAHNISASLWESLVAQADADASSEAAQTVDAARQFAIKQAQEATFRDTNAFSKFVSEFDKNWQNHGFVGRAAKTLVEGIVPFRKTPANVAVRMEEYSPLGVINTVVKAIQASKGEGNVTGADVIDSLSKTLTGTGLALLGFALAQAGKIRTKSDDDKQEAFDRLQGLQDYSINVLGHNLTIDWATPTSGALFMGAEGYNLWRDGDLNLANLGTILGSISSPMLEMSMLSGLNDALNNISNFNDDTDALPQFVLNSAWSYLTQGFTNTLLGQIEQANEEYRQTYYTDPDNPNVSTSMQKNLAQFFNKTPGKDYQAADYIDAWGRKQENLDNPILRYMYALGSPAYISNPSEKSTEVDGELQRLYDYGKDIDDFPNVLPKQVSRSTTVNGKRLSPDEYETYAITKGQESLRLITDLVRSDLYKGLDDDGKAEAISQCYSYAKYLAEEQIAKGRKEEYFNKDYSELITGKDKSGTQYDKTPLDPDNFAGYTMFKIGLDNAVDAGKYKEIDKIVSDYEKQNDNLKTVLSERNAVLRALSRWKDAGLNSQEYYTVQKELVKSQQKLDKSQKTGSTVELDALANVNLPEATKKRLIDSLDDYGSKTVKGVYDVLYSYGFDSKQINDFWASSQDWIYKDSGDPQSSQKAGTLQNLEAAYAIQQLPGLTEAQMTDIYNKLREVAHNPYTINDWGNYTFRSEANYLASGKAKQQFGGKTSTSSNTNTDTTQSKPGKTKLTKNELFEALSKLNKYK